MKKKDKEWKDSVIAIVKQVKSAGSRGSPYTRAHGPILARTLSDLVAPQRTDRAAKGLPFDSAPQCLESYSNAYVFTFENMRNDAMKELREENKATCRFVMGGCKIMRAAIGKGPEDEEAPRVSELGRFLRGNVGLLFTNQSREEVERMFEGATSEDFARAGSKATRTIKIPAGPVHGPGGPMPHTLEPTLRKNGMPTRLVKGVVELVADHTVCVEGAPLTPAQATLLRHFGEKMAVFKLSLVAGWHKGGEGEEVRAGSIVGRAEGWGRDGVRAGSVQGRGLHSTWRVLVARQSV